MFETPQFQLTLPSIDMRPVCPLCRSTTDRLVRWSPYKKWMLCESCNQAYAYPSGDNYEDRERRVELETFLHNRLVRPRPAAERRNLSKPLTVQINFPICEVCGAIHARRANSGRWLGACQVCDDKASIESLWRMRGVFGDDDVETVLDRLYKSHQGLFDRGVLPDAWFQLMIANSR